MQITYHGHSTFRLKGKNGMVVTDPYSASIGFEMTSLSADLVTISHNHADHNAADKVKGTARRKNPFIINQTGEYEIGGISVFGIKTYHDANKGIERGTNFVFTILIDEIKVCHLGDLGHLLTNEQLEDIGEVDVLLCPVGGNYTIDSTQAVSVVRAIDPRVVIPMHFRTDEHDVNQYGDVQTVADFIKEYGGDIQPVAKLDVDKGRLPEETELVLLSKI